MTQKISKEIARKILLNPGPVTTSAQVKESLLQPDICPREAEFGELIATVRHKLLQIVNISDNHKYDSVLFTASGTGAIESCLSSALDTNDTVLILSNGSYGDRLIEICRALELNHEVLNFN